MEANVKSVSKIVGISNKKVILQAMEYLRLLEIKSNLKTQNEYTKIVVCLDISATAALATFNLDDGLKLINYRKSKYQKEKNTILRILGKSQETTVQSICVALNNLPRLKEIEKNATRILEKLKRIKGHRLGDMSHPQYRCMAVYKSCKEFGVKVSVAHKRKLNDLSLLDPNQWKYLESVWCSWLEEPNIVPPVDVMDQHSTTATVARPKVVAKVTGSQAPTNVAQIESYDVWKKRILEKAHADVALLKKQSKRFKLNIEK